MPDRSLKPSAHLKAKLFRGFSDASRLLILETLRQGPATVTDLVHATHLSQPNVSNHLGCLRDCGLVTTAQQGRFAVYRLSGERVGQFLTLADQLLADFGHEIYECTRYNLPEVANGEPAEP